MISGFQGVGLGPARDRVWSSGFTVGDMLYYRVYNS
jgi:hypothetical protein